jgi:2-amino-4-hydroxy-6-hydroxymethyldihydropteridine diphosphokinase
MFFYICNMNSAYLILGSNIGNSIEIIAKANDLIASNVGEITKKSGIYESAAWGNENQPNFLNQALCVSTRFSATALLQTLLAIEEKLGRVRDGSKWMARTIDIDILFYNNDIVETTELKIPHPYIHERRFVLMPMQEIAGELVHPQYKKSIADLLEACPDKLEVFKTAGDATRSYTI